VQINPALAKVKFVEDSVISDPELTFGPTGKPSVRKIGKP
jgi:hypothetical protein